MNFKLTTLGLSLAGILGVNCLFAQTASSSGSATSTTTTTPVATETTEVKTPPLSITGQVDAYYRFSSATAGGLTSYTPATNAFGLGMANVAISKDMGKIGFMADLMFGPRAEATNYNDKSSLAFIKQMYITYKPTDKIKFTLGNFMTFVGYELVEATNNFNYSLSYCYTNGPFHHTGVKADFALSENFGLMVGAFQPTDFKSNVLGKGGNVNFGGQLSYVNGGLKIYLNALTGPTPTSDTLNANASTTVLDLTAMYQVSSKVGLGLEVMNKSGSNYLNDKIVGTSTAFTGFSVYMNYAASDKFILAGRYENFNDSEALALLGAKINAFTLSGNVKIDALTIIPEIRFDSADKELSALGNKKSDVSLILAMTYKF
jgi:Putative beta-barrel porin-2, OmpL-like. bbp2